MNATKRTGIVYFQKMPQIEKSYLDYLAESSYSSALKRFGRSTFLKEQAYKPPTVSMKEWIRQNPEYTKKEYDRAYQRINTDSLKEYRKQYRKNNQSKIKKWHQDFIERNKIRLLKKWREQNRARKGYFKIYHKNMKKHDR